MDCIAKNQIFAVNPTDAQQAIEIVEIDSNDKEAQNIAPAEPPSKPSVLQHVCAVCFDTFPARGVECPSHFMCDDCFISYCQNQIIELGRTYIHCPQHGCDFDYVGRLGKGMFEQMLSNKRTKNVFTKNCATCKAENSLVLGEYIPRLNSRVDLLCNQCHERYCLFCGDALHSGMLVSRLCVNPFRRRLYPFGRHLQYHVCSNNADARLQEYVCNPSNQVKPCPHCFKLIHKIEGCRNVTCAGSLGCGHSFCYDCLSPIQTHQCPAEPLPSRTSRALGYFLHPIVRRVSSGIQKLMYLVATPCRMAHQARRRSVAQMDQLWRTKYPQVLTLQGISIYGVPRKAIRGYIACVGSQHQAAAGMWSSNNVQSDDQNSSGGCYRAYRLHPNAIVYLHTHPANVYCNGQPLVTRNPTGVLSQDTWPDGLSGVSINFDTIQSNRIVERLMNNDDQESWDAETVHHTSEEELRYLPGDVRWTQVLQQLAEQACQNYQNRMSMVGC